MKKVIIFKPDRSKDEVIQLLAGVLPAAYENSEEQSFFSKWFCATELGHSNQEIVKQSWPLQALEDIGVGLYFHVKVPKSLHYSLIVFEGYDTTTNIATHYKSLALSGDDPFFLNLYANTFNKLKSLGWNPITV